MILLVMGGMAGAASFTHVHDVTVAHGQPSWVGWENAIVVELMSIVAGLEIRRRKREKKTAGFVLAVLVAAVAVSLAAQVADAEPSVWGWLVAALPALGFLAVVKIVLSRTPVESGPDRTLSEQVGPATGWVSGPVHGAASGPVTVGQRVPDRDHLVDPTAGAPRSGPAPCSTAGVSGPSSTDRTGEGSTVDPRRGSGRQASYGLSNGANNDGQRSRPCPTGTSSGPDRDSTVDRGTGPDGHGLGVGPTGPEEGRSAVAQAGLDEGRTVHRRTGPDQNRSIEHRSGSVADLLPLGKDIAAKVAAENVKLTREVLITEIRRAGGTVSTDRASELLRLLKTEVVVAAA